MLHVGTFYLRVVTKIFVHLCHFRGDILQTVEMEKDERWSGRWINTAHKKGERCKWRNELRLEVVGCAVVRVRTRVRYGYRQAIHSYDGCQAILIHDSCQIVIDCGCYEIIVSHDCCKIFIILTLWDVGDDYCDIYVVGRNQGLLWGWILWHLHQRWLWMLRESAWQLGSCYGPVTIVKSRSWCLEKKVNPIPANPWTLGHREVRSKSPLSPGRSSFLLRRQFLYIYFFIRCGRCVM